MCLKRLPENIMSVDTISVILMKGFSEQHHKSDVFMKKSIT